MPQVPFERVSITVLWIETLCIIAFQCFPLTYCDDRVLSAYHQNLAEGADVVTALDFSQNPDARRLPHRASFLKAARTGAVPSTKDGALWSKLRRQVTTSMALSAPSTPSKCVNEKGGWSHSGVTNLFSIDCLSVASVSALHGSRSAPISSDETRSVHNLHFISSQTSYSVCSKRLGVIWKRSIHLLTNEWSIINDCSGANGGHSQMTSFDGVVCSFVRSFSRCRLEKLDLTEVEGLTTWLGNGKDGVCSRLQSTPSESRLCGGSHCSVLSWAGLACLYTKDWQGGCIFTFNRSRSHFHKLPGTTSALCFKKFTAAHRGLARPWCHKRLPVALPSTAYAKIKTKSWRWDTGGCVLARHAGCACRRVSAAGR